jgi:hypothetical protein
MDALAAARERAKTAALAQANADGATNAVVTVSEELDAPEIEGSRKLVEARITAVAVGRPRIAFN